ncbi:YrhC family protein [Bacillus atrophaeus]|uniref:YrhC family protein n=1 Tax=Bacillus atrophaeus TaxID=1452 RepID=UPI002E23068D|nr:YrhC family protein [Bacillus atrophaeus]
MDKKKMKSLKEDYKHFAFTLLAVSTFLYIGAVLPDQGLSLAQKSIMMITDCLFLTGAFFCVNRSLIYKKRIEQADE